MKGKLRFLLPTMMTVLLTLLFSGCGGEKADSGAMPWNTGDSRIDSLLDLADAIEIADVYESERLRRTLVSIDSIASSRRRSPG